MFGFFRFVSNKRFYDIAWSGSTIAGALESGSLQIWNPKDILNGKATPIDKAEKHSGAIKAIQFNPVQPHLLASGGAKGEVFVWDMNKFGSPFAPGSQSGRHDEIEAVAWNNNVAHILATGGNTGFTSVWDLKNKREVLHLHYAASGHRSAVSNVAWHPNNSTKLMTASIDDENPVILLWDLRNANAPETVLHGHQKGVLSLDWCKQDSSLMLSSGKDNRTLLWNPESGEQLGEYPIATNWCFKSKFNPRIPDIFASASFDGKITVQTLQDVVAVDKAQPKANGEDFWNPSSYVDTLHPTFTLQQAPKWLKRPVSATFGFGGKIVSVRSSTVTITKFVEDEDLTEETSKFAAALQSDDVSSIVKERIEAATNKFDWEVLDALLSKPSTNDKRMQIKTNLDKWLLKDVKKDEEEEEEEEEEEGHEEEEEKGDGVDEFLSEVTPSFSGSFSLFSKDQSKSEQEISRAILVGDFAKAVELCLKHGNLSDAFMLALHGDDDTKSKVKNAYLSKNGTSKPFVRLLASVTNNNLDDLVENSDVSEWKDTISALFTHCKDDKKFDNYVTKLGDRIYAHLPTNRNDALLCYIAASNLQKTASIWLSEIAGQEREELTSKRANTSYAAHVKALHLFIEKVTIFRNATGVKEDQGVERLFDAYRDYANIVASQGHLDLAEKYLNLLPAQYPGASLEKERVLKAAKKAPAAQQPTKPASGRRHKPTYSTTAASIYAPAAPSAGSAPMAPTSAAPAPIAPTVAAPTAPAASQYAPPPLYAPTAPSQYGHVPLQYAPMAASQGPPNPYQPQQLPAQAAAPPGPPPIGRPLSQPSAPPPPPPSSKKQAGGWNDLPASAISAAPRRPPSTAQTISSPFPNQPLASPPGPSRQPSLTGGFTAPPPTGAQQISPPGMSPPGMSPSNPYAPLRGVVPSAPEPGFNGYSNLPPPRQVASPPANPYAPAPGQQPTYQPHQVPQRPSSATAAAYAPPGGQSRPAVMPPPGMASMPPGMTGVPPAVPPMGYAPGTSPQIAPPAEEEVPPPAPKHPPGDRSHISSEARPIFEMLSGELARVKPAIPPNFTRHTADAEKRLNILFDHLNNEDLLNEDTVNDLKTLSQALMARDYDTAHQLHVDILTTRSEQCGQWMTGVKRLIEMSKAVP
jgi:protein transport protein SEC31